MSKCSEWVTVDAERIYRRIDGFLCTLYMWMWLSGITVRCFDSFRSVDRHAKLVVVFSVLLGV